MRYAVGVDGGGGVLSEARRFLADLLAECPLPVNAIKAETDGAGYSLATMRRAQKSLDVDKVKQGMSGVWVWRLPAHSEATSILEKAKMLNTTEGAQHNKVSTFVDLAHLRVSSAALEVAT